MKMCDINQSGVLEYHEYLLFLPETVKVVKWGLSIWNIFVFACLFSI
jgi:hypothetical protein